MPEEPVQTLLTSELLPLLCLNQMQQMHEIVDECYKNMRLSLNAQFDNLLDVVKYVIYYTVEPKRNDIFVLQTTGKTNE